MSKDSAKPITDAQKLDDFAAGDVNWLDELVLVSQKLPPPEAAMVSKIAMQTQPKGAGGLIKLTGHVDKSDRVSEIQENLRDKQHTVHPKGTGEDPKAPVYVDGRLMIADDNGWARQGLGGEVLEFQFAERKSLNDAARHPARGPAEVVISSGG